MTIKNLTTSRPTLLAGMHRSGTSIIAKLLRGLGLFTGATLEQNDEPPLLIAINDHLLSFAHASWDVPAPFANVCHNPLIINRLAEVAAELLTSPQNLSSYFPQNQSQRGLPTKPWGWKDPRNTITLPVWLKVFPNLKVVYVYRNGVDVACSLRRRAEQDFERFLTCPLGSVAAKAQFLSLRCLTLENAFQLWEDYYFSWKDFLAACGEEALPVKPVCYEDFLQSPVDTTLAIAEHIGLEVTKDMVATACNSVQPARRYAFLRDPELHAFYQSTKDSEAMAYFGYSNLESNDG